MKELDVQIKFVKSKTWGWNPNVRAELYIPGKGARVECSRATGSGYDKRSTAVDQALSKLGIATGASGMGMGELVSRLRAIGWKLTFRRIPGDGWNEVYHWEAE